jgi:hypothetical protein
MRWPEKHSIRFKIGTTRLRRIFLFRPRLDTEHYWRWLEMAMIEEIQTPFTYNWVVYKVLPRSALKQTIENIMTDNIQPKFEYENDPNEGMGPVVFVCILGIIVLVISMVYFFKNAEIF